MRSVVVCVVLGLVATACASDAPHVGGMVHGMWDGVDGVTLHLMSDDVDTLLTVTGNGPFEFHRTLSTGTSYFVVIASNPIDHLCQVVGGGNGVIGNDDAVLDIACVGPSVAIDLAGRGLGVFDPSLDQQKIPGSAFTVSTDLTIHAAPGITAQIFGEPVPLDTPLSRPLEIGITEFVVKFFSAHGLSKAFTVDIDRGAALAPQDVYAKAPEPALYFGSAMAIDGDTLVVAASSFPGSPEPSIPGVVYVFVRSGDGWAQQAKITVPVDEDAASFGASVAVRRDTLVISGSVAAHVYTRRDGVWNAAAAVKPLSGARLGGPVALDGGLLVAGAPSNEVNGATSAGQVYVFVGGDSSWIQQSVLTSDAPAAYQRFGSAIAVEYGTIGVGTGGTGQHTVYMFRPGTELPLPQWSLEQAIVGAVDSGFGASLALHNGILVVGAPTERGPAAVAEVFGIVYTYLRSTEGGWLKTGIVTAPSDSGAGAFGQRVVMADGLLAVGVPRDSSAPSGKLDPAFSQTGAVLLFGWASGTWKPVGYYKASNPGNNDAFGNSVALSPDTLVVGAPLEDGSGLGMNSTGQDSDAGINTGAVYLFR